MPVARTDDSLWLIQHIIKLLLLFGFDLFPVHEYPVSRAYPLPHHGGNRHILTIP